MAETKNRNIEEALARVDEIMQDTALMDLHFSLGVARWEKAYAKHYAEEQGMKKGMKKGMEKGKIKTQIEIAKTLLEDNQPIEYIMKITGLSKEKIEKLTK